VRDVGNYASSDSGSPVCPAAGTTPRAAELADAGAREPASMSPSGLLGIFAEGPLHTLQVVYLNTSRSLVNKRNTEDYDCFFIKVKV
jgi:hypothetical protein